MTDDQLTLPFETQPYGGTPPFEAGSETSEEAAHQMKLGAGSIRSKVYQYVLDRGPVSHGTTLSGKLIAIGGATDDEIEEDLELRHQTASPRRRELVLGKLLRDSGCVRQTSSGRNAVVWEAVVP